MSEMIQIAAFLKRRINKLRHSGGRTSRENLLMWLSWHTARYNACTIKEGNRITAVGVARAIVEIEDARVPYKSDEDGKILYVEEVAADNHAGFKMLLRYVSKRWKNCEKIMFHRSKGGSKNKIYNMNEFLMKVGVI